jgi:bifunctional UDP-N-acetylglucosamine pyrophosphorylase/glucosamine-1-phosphate N-acetyltransferase
MQDQVGALVLAAGKGTRMKTGAPKVLVRLLDRPLLWYGLEALRAVCREQVLVVVGHGADAVVAAFPQWRERFVLQAEQRGTGHALVTAWPRLVEAGFEYALVVNGDAPLVTATSLDAFVREALAARADLAFVTIEVPEVGGYGRVVRGQDGTVAIVEAKDYDTAMHGPVTGEVNAGAYLLRLSAVEPLLSRLTDANANGEYYITDLVALGQAAGLAVLAVNRGPDTAYLGINTPAELVAAEDVLARRIVAAHLEAGVIIRAREAVRIGPEVTIAPGVDLCGPLELYGCTDIAAGAVIASHGVFARYGHRPGCPGAFLLSPGRGGRRPCLPGRTLCPAAPRRGPGARCPGRQFRGDEKIRARRRVQGQPSHLSRRCRGGRGRQYRRRHHHLQL